MHTFLTWLDRPLAEAVGWTLVHFVWQGAVVAAVLALLLASLRRSRLRQTDPIDHQAKARYGLCCAALFVMVLLPVATLVWFWPDARNVPVREQSADALTSQAADFAASTASSSTGLGAFVPESDLLPLASSPTVLNSDLSGALTESTRVSASSIAAAWHNRLRPFIPGLVACWFTGVLCLSLRLISIWWCVQRLCRVQVTAPGERAIALLARLKTQLQISRPVRLVQSVLVEVPTVIGWLWPVILLPASALSGLAPEQFEAILVHELAHIRRGDYLINLLQNVVETLLFYHPAVWWVSEQIRQERENCCDDLATALCGNSLGYAEALLRMEELRQPAGRLALAARGGELIPRVRRLLGAKERDRLPPRWQSGAITLMVIASVALGSWFATNSIAQSGKVAPEAAADSSTRVLQFPEAEALGTLHWHAPSEQNLLVWNRAWSLPGRPEDWPAIRPARGTVRIGGKRDLWLDVPAGAGAGVAALKNLPADSLYALSLRGSAAAKLSDGDLDAIAGLTGLRCLDLAGQPFTDRGLNVLAKLRNLEMLNLTATQAGDETLALVATLPALKFLTVDASRITDAGMKHIGKMSQLELLSFGTDSVKVTDAGLAELAGLPNLTWLMISQLPITDAGVRSLSRIASLRHLDLMNTVATSACLADVARVKNLKSLSLDVPCSVEGVAQIATLERLESLHLTGPFTARGVESLGKLRSLRRLEIWGPTSEDADLGHFADLPLLEELHVSDLTNAGAVRLATNRTIKRLWVLKKEEQEIDDEGLRALANLPLETLVMLNGEKISWAGLEEFGRRTRIKELRLAVQELQGPPSLRFLDAMPELTGLWMQPPSRMPAGEWAHLRNAPKLESLNVGMEIDDAGLKAAAFLPSLKTLSIRGPISDTGLKSLAELADLKTLMIGGWEGIAGFPAITDRGLEHLAGLSKLEFAQIESRALSEPGVSAFMARMPRLKRFRTSREDLYAKPRMVLAGRPAPDFSLTTIDGKQFRLADHRGKTVLVHFWSTAAYRGESLLTELKKVHAEFAGRDDVVFVGIALDESDAPVREVLARHNLPWPQAMVDTARKVAVDYVAVGPPHFCIINSKGMVVADGFEHRARVELRKALGIDDDAAADGPAMALDPVRGTVVDRAGRPVVNARVFLRSRMTGWAARMPVPPPGTDLAQTRTDGRGRFSFEEVLAPEEAFPHIDRAQWRSSLDIVATEPGLAVGWQHVTAAGKNVVELSEPASLSGRVLTGDGKAVAGAEVRLLSLMAVRDAAMVDVGSSQRPADDAPTYLSLVDAALRIAAKTAADGTFRLDQLPAGLGAVLEIDHPGYLVERLYAATTPGALHKEAREQFKRQQPSGEIVAQLRPGRHVAIEVKYEDTGEPAAQAQIQGLPDPAAPASTDAQGRLAIGRLAAGSYRLNVRPPPGTDYLGVAQALDTTRPDLEQPLVIRLPRGATIRGRVVEGQSGRGIAGARVSWKSQRPVAPQSGAEHPLAGETETDFDGRFQTTVPLGAVDLAIVQKPDGYTTSHQRGAGQRRVIAGIGQHAEEVVLKLDRLPHWQGLVVDPEGHLVEGAQIVARSWHRGALSHQVRSVSDTSGRFEIPHGREVLSIAISRIPPRDANVQNDGPLVPPENPDAERPSFNVKPFVDSSAATTLVVHDSGHRLGAVMQLAGPPSGDQPLVVRLLPLQTVTGRAVDASSGRPLQLTVALYRNQGQRALPDPAARPVGSDADGRFAITGLIPGERYRLGFSNRDLADPRLLDFVAGEGPFDAGDIELQPRARVTRAGARAQ